MTGRWPANVILSPLMAQALDKQSGITKSSDHTRHNTAEAHNGTSSMGKSSGDWATSGPLDEGGASRFFLNAGYEQWEVEWILVNGLRPCGG